MLKLIVFEGVQNMPIFAAEALGFFARHGVAVSVEFTPNSWTLRDGLAAGTYDIAHTAVDNAIAMVELAKADVAVVMGGDNGFNGLYVQPDIKSVADLRGQTVLVDAPNTAFALVLYRILAQHGLGRADYAIKSVGATPFRLAAMLDDRANAASILNLPFRIRAEQAGLRRVDEAVDLVGPYLSTAGFVMRPWARANADQLVRYIRAYVEGVRWLLDPVNRGAAIDLLASRLKLEHAIARDALAIAAAPGTGYAADAAVDVAGLENVLAIRALVEGQWGGKPPPAATYLDLSFHARALEA